MNRLSLIFLLLFLVLTSEAKVDVPLRFHAEITYMQPQRYSSRPVTDFYLEMRGDSVDMLLPYMGEVYVPSFDRNSLLFVQRVNSLKTSRTKRGATQVTFDVRRDANVYSFRLTLYDNGMFNAYLSPSHAQPCSYSGEWEELEWDTTVSTEEQLNVNQIEDYRNLVWQEYCSVFSVSDTLPRMSIVPLAETNTCRWQLPQHLEPNAVMNFYFGSKGDQPTSGFPLFIYLHGSGPKDAEWKTGLRLAKSFDDSPSMYVIPQIPNEGQYYRWWQQSKQWAWNHLLRQLLVNPSVDPSRIYLFGISEGGYGSQRLASFYADYLAGAAPMAGGEPLRNAPAENLCNTAFSLVTGEQDAMFYRNKLTLRTKERLDSLKTLYPDEFQYRVMLEQGRGHAINYGVSTPWLKEFRRNAQPKHFRWENYEMDGLKRYAFYNLEVLSELDSTRRYDYEFSISSNVVNLNVRRVDYLITETDSQWGIELNNSRLYKTAESGKVRVYLSEDLADLTSPVTIYVNGTKMGVVQPKILKSSMERSCQLFGDPLRVFPSFIDVEW